MEKLKQKLCGIGLIICGILSILPDHDATAAFLLVPMGLFALFADAEKLEIPEDDYIDEEDYQLQVLKGWKNYALD